MMEVVLRRAEPREDNGEHLGRIPPKLGEPEFDKKNADVWYLGSWRGDDSQPLLTLTLLHS